VLSLRPGGEALMRAVRPIAIAQGAIIAVSFLILIQLFLRTDLSVKLVAANSHSAKPWLYKFAGAWGNHEGSMLLWVMVLGVAGGAVAFLERRLNERTLLATLTAQAAIGLGFYAFLLLASNPFERLNPAPAQGQGLNPLLQDPGPRLPSAHALHRLCRHLDRLFLRGRCARHARRGSRPLPAPCGPGCSAPGSC
jgi:cytochrome c-type biogenesis protein CcmF